MADNSKKPSSAAPMVLGGQEPPHDDASERAVLGAILLDPTVMREIGNVLNDVDFFRAQHRAIYRAIGALDVKTEPVDIVSVSNYLKTQGELGEAGGRGYIFELSTHVPTAVNARYYADLVKGRAIQRELGAFAQELYHTAMAEVDDVGVLVDDAAHKALGLSLSGVKSSVVHIKEALTEAVNRTQKLSESARFGGLSGVPSGFHALDKVTNGWQPGELIVLAARPGMGKTAFALNMLCNAARDTRGPRAGVFFSLEMTGDQLAARLWSSLARVPSERIRSGDLRDVDWKKLWPTVETLSESPIFIDDTAALPIAQMMRKCRQLKHEHNIEIVFVDYLQLMTASQATKNSSREQQISEISRSLKMLAKELRVPVVALSQLNRGVESRTDKRPMLSDLRESGAIEQDADIIVFIYREDYYDQMKGEGAEGAEQAPRHDYEIPSISEIIIAKNRSGPTGKVDVHFHKQFTLFANMDHDEPPPPTSADAPPDFAFKDDDYAPPPPAADGDPFTPGLVGDDDPFAPAADPFAPAAVAAEAVSDPFAPDGANDPFAPPAVGGESRDMFEAAHYDDFDDDIPV